LSAVSEANVASYAAGRETEHRRAVGAPRRPLQSKRSGLPGRAFAAPTVASCDARYKPTMHSP